MIDRVNGVLVELQGALVARALYPTEHPLIKTHEQCALEALREVLERIPEVSVFAVDNRVIFDSHVLPSSPSLAETLFRALHLCGIDRLTFRAGISEDALERFLDGLAHEVSGGKGELNSTHCLSFGSLHDIDELAVGPGAEVDPDSVEEANEAAGVLSEIWRDVDVGKRANAAVLQDVVASLSKVVCESSGAMIPLAPLKVHDEYTFVHTINVALLTAAMGEVLGYDRKTVHELVMAALLHDIGKKAIPSDIVNKSGRYTEEEFVIMKAHPVEGARMLLGMPNIPEIAPIVALEHHVRADGAGYPKLPRGWKLNLASRIVQLADVFDALRTDRPYRKGKSVPAIIELMKQDINTFFDADLLLIFLLEVVSRSIPAASSPVGAGR